MSDFRERQQLGGLSMRKVSFYMEYIARTMQVSEHSRAPKRTVKTSAARDITRSGIPDPWDLEKIPAPQAAPSMRGAEAQPRGRAYAPESFYDDIPGDTSPDQPQVNVLTEPGDYPAAKDAIRETYVHPADEYQAERTYANIPADKGQEEYDDGLDPNAWDFGAGQWREFLNSDTGKHTPISKPEGMRLDSIGKDDNILTEDELRRAMAFLNDDAFLVTGIGVSESARKSIEATSKIQPLTPDMLAFDIAEKKQSGEEEPFEIIDMEMRARGSDMQEAPPTVRTPTRREPSSINLLDEPEEGFAEPRSRSRSGRSAEHEEHAARTRPERSGAKTAFWIFLILFILSLGAVGYLWFFTDYLDFAPPAVNVYEIRLGEERVGHVRDAQQVIGALEEDRRKIQEQSGLTAQQSLPISAQPAVVEERFIAPEDEMIEYLRERTNILVQAAGVYLDGRLIGAVSSGQVLQRAMDDALAPFLALDARELVSIGFVEKLESRDVLVPPESVMNPEDLYAKLTGDSGQITPAVYEVESGDSISSIARRNDIPISQLRYSNPQLIGQDLIKPGMQLKIEQPNSLLTVEFTERVRTETSIPFETITKTSSKLYTTQKETEQKGVSGLREVLVDRRYVAGVLVEETILEETIVREPVNEIVVKGTKKATSSSSSSSKYIMPASGRISSKFGARNGSTHYGLDIAASTGTPIYATRAGTVTFSGTNSTYGKLVKIDHGDGVETRYAHCSALKVKKGDKVKQGQLIALVGSTGRSTGPHLHFEIRINGVAKDPQKYVK